MFSPFALSPFSSLQSSRITFPALLTDRKNKEGQHGHAFQLKKDRPQHKPQKKLEMFVH